MTTSKNSRALALRVDGAGQLGEALRAPWRAFRLCRAAISCRVGRGGRARVRGSNRHVRPAVCAAAALRPWRTMACVARGHSIDEYLETIYFLAFPIGEYRPVETELPTLASRIADMLGVSRPSAGEMLTRLEAEGLVERGARKEAILTPAGRDRAQRVVRKHRLIERFLTDFMGYTAAESHVHADALGETFNEDMIERIDSKLGHPERCPHGWPIDTDAEQAENRELTPLVSLDAGRRAQIVRLAEHDGDLLHWFYAHALVPGSRLEVRTTEPAAGQLEVLVDGSQQAIPEKAAAGLFVRVLD
jgi:DtxR family transcriptional regulator, Mn-dependent transcriptional regulator